MSFDFSRCPGYCERIRRIMLYENRRMQRRNRKIADGKAVH